MKIFKPILTFIFLLFVAGNLTGCSLFQEKMDEDYFLQEEVPCENNDPCTSDETCFEGVCMQVACEDCYYASDHQCLPYECCLNIDCNDNKISTNDICQGKSGESRSCIHKPITDCAPGDSYCPYGCQYDPDTDCPEPEPELSTSTEEAEQ